MGMGMIARRKLNHTGAGLLSKFLTRYNDVDAYWALGVLYTEARMVAMRVDIDMLDGSVEPALPACVSVGRTWALHLRQALARHGIAPDALVTAIISIEFGLPLPERPGYPECGDPFVCTLRLRSRDGREFVRQAQSCCMPHEEHSGRRSVRPLPLHPLDLCSNLTTSLKAGALP